jgi:hypothetical protein
LGKAVTSFYPIQHKGRFGLTDEERRPELF